MYGKAFAVKALAVFAVCLPFMEFSSKSSQDFLHDKPDHKTSFLVNEVLLCNCESSPL